MTISFLPALRMVFTTNDSRPPLTVYQPYAVLPTDALKDRAETGECGSLLELGERYYFGTEVEQNYETALSYLRRAAEQNAQDAEYLIAECYRNGFGVEQDYDAYFEWMFRAAEHGSWMAMFHISAAYHDGRAAYDGHGVDIDLKKCFEWSIQTEKAIHAYWKFYTGDSFVDFVETKSRLMQAYVRAASQISEHYVNGVGTEKDLSKALYWLRRGKKFITKAIGDREIPMLDTKIAELNEKLAAQKEATEA